jgi:uncharacterized repeat protein (TIGR03803 family)
VFKITSAGVLTTLHSFNGTSGSGPQAGLLQGSDGDFYGTTVGGGPNGFGTVFKMTSSGVLTTLHFFDETETNGINPFAGLVLGSDGAFYGTTSVGGTGGAGTVFKITSSGVLTTLHSFNNTNGDDPRAGLVLGSDGAFYGTTTSGGAINIGTVFKITPAGAHTLLHTFDYSKGAYPKAGLTLGSDGFFYGTTSGGGASNRGAVIKVTSAGVLTTLHSFNGTDGRSPHAGLVEGSDGNFYGTTLGDGGSSQGTVFKITSAGVLTTLHSFNGTDGRLPYAGLVEGSDGDFYGTTYGDGGSNRGTVFKITPAGFLTTLHSFNGTNGSGPQAGLVQSSDGDFYGTTGGGGASGVGTVFKITSAGVLTTLHSFNGTNGSSPVAALVQSSGGDFYGTALGGGASGAGTVFKITSAGVLTTLHSFNTTNGANPEAGLVQGSDGDFYGTTLNGGANGYGTVFKISPSGTYTLLHSFDFSPAAFPSGTPTFGTDGHLYGTAHAMVVWKLTLATPVVTATYTSATDVPVTAASYTATGQTVNFTLSYAPTTGTALTVVKNTGLGFISGTFDNLAQGQAVALSFGGVTYNFVANYFGGSGNDLVLVWAGTRAMGWGNNNEGQLGNNTLTSSRVLVPVSTAGVLAGKTVIAVSGGEAHSLALCSDGTLAAWGGNYNGQLGNGSTTQSNVPTAVSMSGALAGKTVIAIEAGFFHNLALCSDGTVVAWGAGPLGNGSTTQSNVPVAVNTSGALSGKTVVAVTTDSVHSLALCSDGTVVAWGANYNGQLGDGTTTASAIPVVVNTAGVLAGKTVIAVQAGGSWYSMALCSDGTLAAWGGNGGGYLGNGGGADSSLPVLVDTSGVLAGKFVIAVSSGDEHSLALCSDGTVAAWGGNNYAGELGYGSDTPSSVPVAVSTAGVLAGKTVIAVSAGELYSLALCSDGTMAAWGSNFGGLLGDGSTTHNSYVPVAVSASSLAAGDRFVGILSGDFSIHSLALVAPAQAPAPTISTVTPAMGTTAGGTNVTITGTDFLGATAVTFGGMAATSFTVDSATQITATTPTHAAGAVSVEVTTPGGTNAANTLFTYVVLPVTATYTSATDVPVTAASYTATGQTVNFTLSYAPTTGTALTVVKNTGLGFISGTFDNLAQGQAVALSFGGVTYNFVANYFGGSGNDLVLVWAGTRAMGWGYNGAGQLGNNTLTNSSVPVPVSTAGVLAGKTVIAVSGGEGHSLALCSDGTLAAWGWNYYGVLGNGSTTQSNVPTAVSMSGALAGKTVIAIEAGFFHNLALCSDGAVVAWGDNYYGQLGNGSTTQSNVPVSVNTSGALSGKTVVAVTTDSTHSLAICSDGTVVAWGANYNGQLGDGTTTSSATPVVVNTSGVLAGKTVIAVSTGYWHSMALCSDGTLAAWGGNSNGQLGNGGGADSSLPVLVDTSGVLAGKSIIAVSSGYEHSLALCSDGTIAAWGGHNYEGELGDGSDTASSVPVAVTTAGVLAGKNVIAVSALETHSLALCSDGTLTAWGRGGEGILGNGSTITSLVPVAVDSSQLAAGDRFIAVASGALSIHSLALVAPAQAPAPTISTVTPAMGTTAGGTNVTITGTDLLGATAVTFGGMAATSFTVVSATQITATTPAHAAGAVSVEVTTPGGTNAANTLFTYITPEIVVHDGSHSLAPELSDGQVTVVSFGSTAPNVASVRSFLVRNTGDADLTISSITMPSDYVTNGGAAVLAPGTSYGFQVALSSATPATYAGSITVNSDDLNEAAFDFPITGTVVAPGSAPVVNVGGEVAVPGATGSTVSGGPVGSTLYSFIGSSPALNSSGVLASAVQIRHADGSVHSGMMVGQPLALIYSDNDAAPSLPGVTHFFFNPPVINEASHIAFTGEVRGAGVTDNVNSRCLFSNASDGVLKLVARIGMNVGLGSNLKTIGAFSIGGDLVIFLGTLVDNRIVLFGWDANTGLRPLVRTGQSLIANGANKIVKSFSILTTTNASSGHGKELSVAPTGESLVTFSVVFTDSTSGVVVGSFDGTSDTGFGLTYGTSQQLADTYATAPGVIPLAKWGSFRSPSFDNTGSYYGFISQMVDNTLAGVGTTNNIGIFVDTAPGVLTLQLRENDAAPGTTAGVVFSDFSDLVLGGGDYEFLVKGELRGTGVVTNVNNKGLWAQHATNGLVLVAREGSEAPGVAGSTFLRLNQIALPGTAQPLFQATMTAGLGGVTTANDTGLWVINETGAVKLAVREGDTLSVDGTPRVVTTITALLNGTTTGGALGRRVFLQDGQMTLLLTFSGGIQAHAKVVVP